jgi:DNA polymerase alpha subunit A
MHRNVYLLPRPYVFDEKGNETDVENDLEQVEGEFGRLAQHQRIKNWSLDPVSKKYAFEVADVPVEADWVQLTYPYSGKLI